MDEFHRNMLRIGGIRPSPESQQAAASQEPLGHLAAGFGQTLRFAREESLEQS